MFKSLLVYERHHVKILEMFNFAGNVYDLGYVGSLKLNGIVGVICFQFSAQSKESPGLITLQYN